ncbi:MAG: S8 family peptidase [Candidatus Wallbacteria bacterium]|nr:S8 family peptidase [Candidatus Wallbacteria bacterium]
MPNEKYRHIFLAGPTNTQRYSKPKRKVDPAPMPERDPLSHSTLLIKRLEKTWEQAEERKAVSHSDRDGAYLVFNSEPGFELALQSLENSRAGIKLLNVRKITSDNTEQTLATVFIPFDKRGFFLNKIEAYASEADPKATEDGKRKHAKLVESITDIKLAILESFWDPDKTDSIPAKNHDWIEVWLSSNDEQVQSRFEKLLVDLKIESKSGVLKFPERLVKLIRINRTGLEKIIEFSDDIAEFQPVRKIATFFLETDNKHQTSLVRELVKRAEFSDDQNVVVCILDSGVNNGHQLIEPLLDGSDLHSVIQEWGVADNKGHGTLMAGTVAYGDLLDLLNNSSGFQVPYRLESVKILPPAPATNPKELWGYFTIQGVSKAEIQAPSPDRKRIICMAVTSVEESDRGRPTSWSAALDDLASDSNGNNHRLIIISSGNVDDPENWRNYPTDNKTAEVQNPAQSWNALTVGAFTEKIRITDGSLSGYTPVAPEGGLAPTSSTSLTWPTNKWPIKPEVLFEGGNVAKGPNDSIQVPDELQLISTWYKTQEAQFASFGATSAASALAARFAARIQVMYPDAWPETIRALLVHSAQWTAAMKSQFLPKKPNKGDYAEFLRLCGYGVPILEKALYCASNSLTLISQAELQPYDKTGGYCSSRDMHLYKLPWPIEALRDLGSEPVEMRVTLSYFIEPGPGEVGWSGRYRYASHALRFQLNGPGETETEFVPRINAKAREAGEKPDSKGPTEKWLIGEARDVGSIHSDIWKGTAAELAASNLIAVFPVVGWWKERHHLNRWNKRCRYSLIVSIHTQKTEIDIYTPVLNMIRTETKIPIIRRQKPLPGDRR